MKLPLDKAIEKAKLIRDEGWSSAIYQFSFIDQIIIELLTELENKDKIVKEQNEKLRKKLLKELKL